MKVGMRTSAHDFRWWYQLTNKLLSVSCGQFELNLATNRPILFTQFYEEFFVDIIFFRD